MTPNPKTQPQLKSQTESEWEEEILEETLKDVIDEDGNLNFDKLRSKGVDMTLQERYTDDPSWSSL